MAISVFLVEDDPHIRDYVRRTIEADPGMRLTGVAGTVRQAETAMKGLAVDVLMVDLGLPDGSGIDVIRAAREDCVSDSILVFSVLGDESKVLAAIEAGAHGYILKGGPPEELSRAIRQVAEGDAPISPSIARYLLKRLQGTSPARAETPAERLSGREVEVLQLIAQGFIQEEIAKRLFIAHHTVSTHVRNVYRKLQVHGKGQAVAKGHELGYL